MPSIKGTASIISDSAQNKLLRKTKFPSSFAKKVDLSKVNVPVMTQWIESQIESILGFEDEIVSSMAVNLFFPQIKSDDGAFSSASISYGTVDPRRAQLDLTGFLGEAETPKFASQLWEMILDAQNQPMGIPRALIEKKKAELAQQKQKEQSMPGVARGSTNSSCAEMSPLVMEAARRADKARKTFAQQQGQFSSQADKAVQAALVPQERRFESRHANSRNDNVYGHEPSSYGQCEQKPAAGEGSSSQRGRQEKRRYNSRSRSRDRSHSHHDGDDENSRCSSYSDYDSYGRRRRRQKQRRNTEKDSHHYSDDEKHRSDRNGGRNHRHNRRRSSRSRSRDRSGRSDRRRRLNDSERESSRRSSRRDDDDRRSRRKHGSRSLRGYERKSSKNDQRSRSRSRNRSVSESRSVNTSSDHDDKKDNRIESSDRRKRDHRRSIKSRSRSRSSSSRSNSRR